MRALGGASLGALPGLLSAALLGALLAGCSHPTLGKPVFIGASATAGVGATTSAAPEGELPVDLAVAYAAVVSAAHSDPRRLGDGAFFLQPRAAAADQAKAASAEPSTIVFAVDWLFWPVYAGISAEDRAADGASGGVQRTDAQRTDEQIRRERLDAALAHLERFDAPRTPIVLGDVPLLPDGNGAPPAVELPSARPSADDVASLNGVIRAWASERPWVVLLPVAELFAGNRTLPDGTPLLQPDELHPTAAGLVRLVQMSMEALEARGLVQSGDWRRDVTGASSRLATASREALQSPMVGWLDTAAIYSAYEELSELLMRQPPECERVVSATDRLFARAVRLDRDPTGYGLGAAMASGIAATAIQSCPDAALAIRRAIERLGFETRGNRPNAFKLELWVGLLSASGRIDEAVARLTAMAALADGSDADQGEYLESYRTVAARLRSAGADAASPARRAQVVALYGGVGATVAQGQRMIRECLAPAVDPRATPALREMIDATPSPADGGADRPIAGRRDPRSLPVVATTLDDRSAARLASFAAQIQPIHELVRDLRCAGSLGDATATEGAETLLAELDAAFGVAGRGLAIARGGTSGLDAVLPGWGIAASGNVDFDAERAWTFGSAAAAGDLLRNATAVMRLVSSGRTMGVLLKLDVDHAIGQLGTIEAADGVATILDGVSVVSVAVDGEPPAQSGALVPTPAGTTLRSRPVAPDDSRRQSIRAVTRRWQQVSLPPCADLAALHAAAWAAAVDAGLDVAWPFPLRVDGEFEAIDVRIDRAAPAPPKVRAEAELIETELRGAAPIASPPALMVPKEPMRLALPAGRATLVGFAAPWSVGSLVRPGLPMRLHAVWTDSAGTVHTGEVEAVRGASGLAMKVPAAE